MKIPLMDIKATNAVYRDEIDAAIKQANAATQVPGIEANLESLLAPLQ